MKSADVGSLAILLERNKARPWTAALYFVGVTSRGGQRHGAADLQQAQPWLQSRRQAPATPDGVVCGARRRQNAELLNSSLMIVPKMILMSSHSEKFST
jgi:hypothetical protein